MKYENVTINNKEELRQKIQEFYSRDIQEASCHFSSRNYAFVFSEGPFPVAIRVSINSGKSREDVISELMWVDDLRLQLPTVSQAVLSNNNNIAEDFSLGDTQYCATMFRKANGDVLPYQYWNTNHFREVGRVLGQIHKAGKEGYELGFRYKRCQWYEKKTYDFTTYLKFLDDSVRQKAQEVVEAVKAIPENPEWYGMIHGDYQNGNLFVDWDKIWVFDFDDCCYGYFMYDVAAAMQIFVMEGRYRPGESRREVFYGKEGIYPSFREGYEEVNHLPDSQWDMIELFLKLRMTETANILIQSGVIEGSLMKGLLASLTGFFANDRDFFEMVDETLEQKTKQNINFDSYKNRKSKN